MTNEELLAKIGRGFTNYVPVRELRFGVQIVEHCNLNCKLCNHLSSLADEEYLDVKSYKKDMDRLSELFDGKMARFTLTGGEPLLHPQVTEFIEIAREAFPVGLIVLFTNGLLLPAMPESFWEACRKNDVLIEATCYPVKFDYAGLKKSVESRGVKYSVCDIDRSAQYKFPIQVRPSHTDMTGINFFNCDQVHCVGLRNGKMYPCPISLNAVHAIRKFNLNIPLPERDAVDIYSVSSGNELLEKMARPVPFCQYCEVTDVRISCDWGISKKDRYEWLTFGFTDDDIQYLKTKKPVVYVFGAGERGRVTVHLLKTWDIEVKNVLATRKKQGVDNIYGVPFVTMDELGDVEPNSICLVSVGNAVHKSEVYPILCQKGFGDVVPVSGLI